LTYIKKLGFFGLILLSSAIIYGNFGPARLFGGRYPVGRAIATRIFSGEKAAKKCSNRLLYP